MITAAGHWASAGVGMAFGIGFSEGALTASTGIYIILSVLQRWEHCVHKKVRLLDVYIEVTNTMPLNKFARHLRAINLQIEGIQLEPDSSIENETRAFVVTFKSPKREDHLKLLEEIKPVPGIVYAEAL